MRSPKLIMPQQIRAATPPIIGSVIAGGWDSGDWRTLNLDTLRQIWRLSERIHPVGKLDSRNAATATIPCGATAASVHSGTITVPTGELWFVQSIYVLLPYSASCVLSANFRISRWPDDDASPANALGKAFWASDKVLVDGRDETFQAEFYTSAPNLDKENLDVPLRLLGGDTITLEMTLVSGSPAAACGLCPTITPYGYKALVMGT